MSTYNLPDLLHKWERGELTAEQTIGQLLQHQLALEKRLSEIEKHLRPPEQPPVKPQG